jgi:transposase InsO family protein
VDVAHDQLVDACSSPSQLLYLEMLRRPLERKQYASHDYREALDQAGITCSMSRRGDCWDNAVAESFFATLKMELLYELPLQTRGETRSAVADYIETDPRNPGSRPPGDSRGSPSALPEAISTHTEQSRQGFLVEVAGNLEPHALRQLELEGTSIPPIVPHQLHKP